MVLGGFVLLMGIASGDLGNSANGQEASPPPLRLSLRSNFGEFVVPANRRLGTFAIDMGLSIDGDEAAIKRQYVMERVLAYVTGSKVQRASDYRCDLALLLDNYYPYILGFLYRGSQSSLSGAASAADCLGHFQRVFETIENDDLAVIAALRDLARQRRSQLAGAGPGDRKNPILAATDAIREFERWIYADGTVMHALVALDAHDYEAVSTEQFRSWMKETKDKGHIRFVSEDPEFRRVLGEQSDNQVPLLPFINAAKKHEPEVQLAQFESTVIRAAVFVAVATPADDRVRNDVTAKYCREPQNDDAGAAREHDSLLLAHCLSDAVFGREKWLALYFGADDGRDEDLLEKVQKIAADPLVVQLAGQMSANGTPATPYIVQFGSRW